MYSKCFACRDQSFGVSVYIEVVWFPDFGKKKHHAKFHSGPHQLLNPPAQSQRTLVACRQLNEHVQMIFSTLDIQRMWAWLGTYAKQCRSTPMHLQPRTKPRDSVSEVRVLPTLLHNIATLTSIMQFSKSKYMPHGESKSK